jgi:DNA-binding transcriptional ArsR family regulator
MSHEELAQKLRYFKALADESRLKLLGALAANEASVEELAERLRLKGPTVSHHLAKLREAGLVSMRTEGNTHLHALNVAKLHELGKTLFATEAIASLADDVDAEAWERKVLADFFEGERLKEIPASRKKREVVLKWLAGRFETDRRYPEKEVNEVIKKHHPDFATLRRELIGADLMKREAGIYWR